MKAAKIGACTWTPASAGVHGGRGGAVTADTDPRLTPYSGLSQGFSMRLQISRDLMERRRKMGAAGDD